MPQESQTIFATHYLYEITAIQHFKPAPNELVHINLKVVSYLKCLLRPLTISYLLLYRFYPPQGYGVCSSFGIK